LIPDLLIRAWIQKPGYEGGYPVMSILAAVLLIHQPIYVLTQFLIARARQREVAIVSIVTTLANLGLSFLLAWVWGIWGVAASTLVTDAAALAYIVPRYAAPAAGTTAGALFRAIARPAAPALVVAAAVLVALARVWRPGSLLALAPLGLLWTVMAVAAVWRYGLAKDERLQVRGELLRGRGARPAAADI
jgi:O-antigen/teichoic acid export membrane protein